MVSILLLTQSRAGIGVALIVVVVTVAWLRDAAALLRAVPVFIGAAVLISRSRRVDRSLVDQHGVDHALRVYAGWSCLVIVAVGVLAIPALNSRRVRAACSRLWPPPLSAARSSRA